MAGLLYLQHAYRLSDDAVVARWVENPYYQHLTGETFFQHRMPIDPSSLTRWRGRIGEEGVEWLLTQTIRAGQKAGAIDEDNVKRMAVDTTVMDKAIAHPTVLSQTFAFLRVCGYDIVVRWLLGVIGGDFEVIDFSGVQFPKAAILYTVFFYLRYAVSYRNLEEIMAERGIVVDHATLNRWVVKFSPLIAVQAQARKRLAASSWRMDETYLKVKGQWTYLYRAVDRNGGTLDFMLSERRDLAAARRFFRRAIAANGVPDRVVIDKSAANLAGLQAVNVILKFTNAEKTVKKLQVKYLNNILPQDHRFIKRITAPMMGFKAFHSAAATIAGIETAHMIRKGQIPANRVTAFQQFAELAA